MEPSVTFFLLSILCLSFEPCHVAADHGNNTRLIEHACKHSSHGKLCVASLSSDPSSQHADLKGLTTIAINLAYTNATNIKDRIDELANNNTVSEPSIQQGLDDCKQNYLDATEQLENSLAAVSANAYTDGSNWLKAAVADAESCESAFQGVKFELSRENRVFRQLANNALSVLKVLTEK